MKIKRRIKTSELVKLLITRRCYYFIDHPPMLVLNNSDIEIIAQEITKFIQNNYRRRKRV